MATLTADITDTDTIIPIDTLDELPVDLQYRVVIGNEWATVIDHDSSGGGGGGDVAGSYRTEPQLVSTTDADTYVTPSWTPTADRLVLVTVSHRVATVQPNQPSLSGNGLTWDIVRSEPRTTLFRTTVFRAVTGSTPTAGALTATFAAQVQAGCIIEVSEFTNVPLTNNGADAIRQFRAITGSSTDVPGATFSLAVEAGNAAFFAYQTGSAAGVAPPSGWTELADLQHGSPNESLQTAWRADAVDTFTPENTSTNWVIVGIELIVGGSGGSPAGATLTVVRDDPRGPVAHEAGDTVAHLADPTNPLIGDLVIDAYGLTVRRGPSNVLKIAATGTLQLTAPAGSVGISTYVDLTSLGPGWTYTPVALFFLRPEGADTWYSGLYAPYNLTVYPYWLAAPDTERKAIVANDTVAQGLIYRIADGTPRVVLNVTNLSDFEIVMNLRYYVMVERL